VQLSALDGLIRDTTALVSVIHANNEIGTINPIAEIGAVCRRKGVPLHTDSVQAAAHLSIDVQRDQIDLMSIGAHKFYGPKGVGGLFVRKGISIMPIQFGGGQEYGLRAGTQNVPYIVGMAEALRIAQHGVQERGHRLSLLRDELIRSVVEHIPGTFLTGHPVERLPNHASFVFEGVDGNDLLMRLDMAGFACSSGSACKVGVPKPSEVLTAIGLSPELALGSLRVTLGKDTTQQEVESFLSTLPALIQQTRDARG
ncbi:MAG: cysteine desulfurase family protein, partial [Anaerolineaceae bacterium]|nr:cysteine desulfurase family protein [Anaerolineaceae bacterium]